MLDELSSNLAFNLRRLREARGLTQQRLSAVSGVPRPTLAHLESGEANPTLGVIARVASALNVALEELITPQRSVLAHHPRASLSEHSEGGVLSSLLSPEAPSHLAVERLELAARATLERAQARRSERYYLVCERGDVEVFSARERCLLRTLDLAVVSRGAAHGLVNRGRGSAVVYSVRVAVAVG